MKALVAGGTGFIGSHIVEDLLARGIRVRILTRSNYNKFVNHNEIETVSGNILDVDSLKRCMKDVDLVYSAFGILGQWNIPDQTYWQVNTDGVRNLLQICLHSNIQQFIHISSAGVLGPLPDDVIADESFPFKPSNVYEQTKCEAEKKILDYGKRHGIPFTIIRPEFVYGPGDTHVLGLFKAISTKKFFLLGKGTSLLHPTYIGDLIQGVSLCTNNSKAIGNTFLIAGPQPITVKDLAKTIAEESGVPLREAKIPLLCAKAVAKILESAACIAKFEPVLTTSRVRFFTENRAFSFQKARNELGFLPQVDFREGVRKTLRWYRESGYL